MIDSRLHFPEAVGTGADTDRTLGPGGTNWASTPLNPDAAAVRLRDRVQLEIANLKEATECIIANHYLHRGRTMAQLPYWIRVDGSRSGVLLFAYPRMSAKYQGYGPMNLLELARMWLDPSVQGMRVIDSQGKEHAFSVATCAVGMALRQVRQDWHLKYPHLPEIQAVVSWADQVHHEGTIYRASNFRETGKASGGSLHGSARRPNGGRDQLNPDYLHPKTAFIFEFKSRSRRKPDIGIALEGAADGVSADKLAEVEGGITGQSDAMATDVGHRNLGIVDRRAPQPDVSETLELITGEVAVD